MKITYTGLTSEDKLVDTILEHDRLGTTRRFVLDVIMPMMERCIEVRFDDVLAGYLMIFNTNGQRSFHGYKLVKGHSVAAFKIAKEFVNRYPDLFISHVASRGNVNRLAKLLGFKETYRNEAVVKLEKNNVAETVAA